MVSRLDWTERLTIVLAIAALVTLGLTTHVGGAVAWLVWSAVWILLAGAALVAVNRSDSGGDR